MRLFLTKRPLPCPQETPCVPTVLLSVGAMYRLDPDYSRNAFDARSVAEGGGGGGMVGVPHHPLLPSYM